MQKTFYASFLIACALSGFLGATQLASEAYPISYDYLEQDFLNKLPSSKNVQTWFETLCSTLRRKGITHIALPPQSKEKVQWVSLSDSNAVSNFLTNHFSKLQSICAFRFADDIETKINELSSQAENFESRLAIMDCIYSISGLLSRTTDQQDRIVYMSPIGSGSTKSIYKLNDKKQTVTYYISPKTSQEYENLSRLLDLKLQYEKERIDLDNLYTLKLKELWKQKPSSMTYPVPSPKKTEPQINPQSKKITAYHQNQVTVPKPTRSTEPKQNNTEAYNCIPSPVIFIQR